MYVSFKHAATPYKPHTINKNKNKFHFRFRVYFSEIITDGEGYRENMYWFYQLRLDGVDAINKIRKDFTLGGSMKGVDLSKTHGTKGFGIECAVVKDEIKKNVLKIKLV